MLLEAAKSLLRQHCVIFTYMTFFEKPEKVLLPGLHTLVSNVGRSLKRTDESLEHNCLG